MTLLYYHIKPTSICILICLMCFPDNLPAQLNGADPFLGNYQLGNSSEMVMIWSDTGSTRCNQNVFDFIGENNIVIKKSLQTVTGDSGISGNKNISLACGDFNGDGNDDFAAAWEGPDHSIIMMIPQINDATLDWSNATVIKTASNVLNEHTPHYIRLVAGDFDADSDKELLLAYWSADGSIVLTIYDTDRSLVPVEKSVIKNETLDWSYLGEGFTCFDIACANFDNDCFDEIVLIGIEPRRPTHRSVFARIYEVNPDTYTMTAKARHTSIYEDSDNPLYRPRRLAVACGDLNGDYSEEVIVGIQVWKSNQDETHHYLQYFQISSDLNSVIIDKTKLVHQDSFSPGTYNFGYPLDVATGDLNGDGLIEVLATAMKQANLYSPYLLDGIATLVEIDEIELTTQYWDDSGEIIIINDLDANPDTEIWLPEVVISENRIVSNHNQFRIRVFEPVFFEQTDSLTIDSLHLRSVWEHDFDDNDIRQMAIALGDFDGDGIRLGTPERYRKTDILQPTVILNAPPIHFDIFDDVIYDINGCCSGGGCGFYSVYETEYTEGYEVVTEVHSDWGIDASLSAGGSFMGMGVKARLAAYYGENFSKIEGKSQTITTGVRIEATYDDRIYATTSTYDLWEYPLYSKNQMRGYILVVDPAVTRNEWFASKSWTAQAYVPDHEVGNLLSYPSYSELIENEDVAQPIKMADSYGIDSWSLGEWWLRMVDFESQQELKSWQIGLEVGASIQTYGLELSVNGYYDHQEISTHVTTVERALSLEVYLGSISSDEAAYSVTPNAYWAKNGALVLDYSVDLALSGPGGTETWWKHHYEDFSDPSFILPFRYDPEKGFPLQDETKRFRTNDISFHPEEPQPGDIITISARIHNFSLINTSDPVQVRFYLGDPDDGGIALVGTQGESHVTTDNIISSQDYSVVQMDWEIPQNIQNFPRIYAVVDPQGIISEVHENNNKGYRVLLVTGGAADISDAENQHLPEEYHLFNAYPNPFNPLTTIKFTLPKSETVRLEVINILGQQVNLLLDKKLPGGIHTVRFDAQNLPSGTYFYRIHAGDFTRTKKMIFLK